MSDASIKRIHKRSGHGQSLYHPAVNVAHKLRALVLGGFHSVRQQPDSLIDRLIYAMMMRSVVLISTHRSGCVDGCRIPRTGMQAEEGK